MLRRLAALPVAIAAVAVSSTWLHYFLFVLFAVMIVADAWLEERSRRGS